MKRTEDKRSKAETRNQPYRSYQNMRKRKREVEGEEEQGREKKRKKLARLQCLGRAVVRGRVNAGRGKVRAECDKIG